MTVNASAIGDAADEECTSNSEKKLFQELYGRHKVMACWNVLKIPVAMMTLTSLMYVT